MKGKIITNISGICVMSQIIGSRLSGEPLINPEPTVLLGSGNGDPLGPVFVYYPSSCVLIEYLVHHVNPFNNRSIKNCEPTVQRPTCREE